MRILFVEDNEHLRETLELMLEGPDREVVACADGEQALQACQAQAFDLVLTDVTLPGMSGIDLARELLSARPAQWIVFCSGYNRTDLIKGLGPNTRFLPKPFEMDELDALIEEAGRDAAA